MIGFSIISDVIAYLKLFGQTKIVIKPSSKSIMWESFRALSQKKPTNVLQTSAASTCYCYVIMILTLYWSAWGIPSQDTAD